jgi:predicted nucleotidyltransferase
MGARQAADPKQEAIEVFVSRLKATIGDKLLGIYLFGSTAKGEATPQSDIDILFM